MRLGEGRLHCTHLTSCPEGRLKQGEFGVLMSVREDVVEEKEGREAISIWGREEVSGSGLGAGRWARGRQRRLFYTKPEGAQGGRAKLRAEEETRASLVLVSGSGTGQGGREAAAAQSD
jgi:hypothetical protein